MLWYNHSFTQLELVSQVSVVAHEPLVKLEAEYLTSPQIGMDVSDGSSLHPGGKVFGRFQFIQESPEVAIGSILVLTMASIIGNFGNILILVAVYKILPRGPWVI